MIQKLLESRQWSKEWLEEVTVRGNLVSARHCAKLSVFIVSCNSPNSPARWVLFFIITTSLKREHGLDLGPCYPKCAQLLSMRALSLCCQAIAGDSVLQPPTCLDHVWRWLCNKSQKGQAGNRLWKWKKRPLWGCFHQWQDVTNVVIGTGYPGSSNNMPDFGNRITFSLSQWIRKAEFCPVYEIQPLLAWQGPIPRGKSERLMVCRTEGGTAPCTHLTLRVNTSHTALTVSLASP